MYLYSQCIIPLNYPGRHTLPIEMDEMWAGKDETTVEGLLLGVDTKKPALTAGSLMASIYIPSRRKVPPIYRVVRAGYKRCFF